MTTTTRTVRTEGGGSKLAGPQRPRWSRRRVVVIGVAAGVVFAVLATWLVAFSSVFGVRTVEVRGISVLTADEVRAAADITDGTPLVRLDTTAVTRRVEQLPEVASAQVSTSFPSTVVITVEERVAVGYVRRGGHVRLVDRTGAVFRTVNAVPSGLPHFVVPSGVQQRDTAAAVAAVAAALPPALLGEVRSIGALNPTAITLVLTRHRQVRWGSADRTAEKAELLPALLHRWVVYVDLTDPDQPYTRR
jgi:cell division protein FtsQ